MIHNLFQRFLDRWCRAVEAAETPDLSLEARELTARREIDSMMQAVKYAPGVLEARGSKNGQVVLTDKRETTGAPAKLVLRPDRSKIAADGEDLSMVAVEVVDAQGRVVPTASNLVTFNISGNGRLIGVGNGDPSCHEPDKADKRSAFNGLCMAFVQSLKQSRSGDSFAVAHVTLLRCAKLLVTQIISHDTFAS